MNAVGRLGALVCTLVVAGGAVAQFPTPTKTLKLPEPRVKADVKAPGAGNGDKAEAWKAWQPAGKPLTLAECLAIAQERQPAITAAAASLAAAERGYLALLGLRRAAELFSPDLPVRRQQAQRGLAASCAEVVKVRQENTYDVCRLYFTYVYATQQEQTASEIVTQLEEFYKLFVELLKQPLVDPKLKLNEFSLGTFDAVIAEVRDLREKASTGRKKAYYALQEAMGVCPEFEFVPADKELPLMGGTVDQQTVVQLALSRRAELVQSAVLVDVTRLEVNAQAKLTLDPRANTFASGSDLHSKIIPMPVRNGEYRPGAIPPEMPTVIAGKVDDRVARVCEYVRYHEAMYEKSVNLVRLEAINAFLTWEAATKRVEDARERHKRAQDLVDKARLAAQTKMDPELLIQTESLASKAQARYVEAVFDQILALVALEKVTGGGIRPAFPQR